MILDDFIVIDKIGLFCRYGNFYLDPQEPVNQAVVSHAHGDHAIGGSKEVHCTSPTKEFMVHRYKKFAAAEFHVYGYHEAFTIGGVRISFIPAGHMLGSAMVLMEYQDVKYLYTGDYKLQTDKTCEPIEFATADVLITETTFADPNTKHPIAEEEILNLNTTESNIMLGAYALGKCQRLISLMNEYCPQKRILVHHSMLPFVRIYEQQGINLGKYEIYDRKVMKSQTTNVVYMVPPMVFKSYIKAINVVRVFASGWKHLQHSHELQLCISDHADWSDIIHTIEKVKPKQVWTNHGNGMELKTYYENSLVVKLLN